MNPATENPALFTSTSIRSVIANDLVDRARQRIKLGNIEPSQVKPITHSGFLCCLFESSTAREIAHGGDYRYPVGGEFYAVSSPIPLELPVTTAIFCLPGLLTR